MRRPAAGSAAPRPVTGRGVGARLEGAQAVPAEDGASGDSQEPGRKGEALY